LNSRVVLAREAMRSALQLRRSLSVAREEPINVYDVAEAIGVEVRFMDLPSLEGMFLRDPHVIVVLPSLKHRPRGRVTFSCAHEIGHFQLGHGTTVDKYVVDSEQHGPKSDNEFAADTFASSVLMPRPAVLRRFDVRHLAVPEATPMQLFGVAGELDVGYGTLLNHIRYGLQLADDAWLKHRQRTTPKQIRFEILGDNCAGRLLLVDNKWPGVPIDLEIGDWIAIPKDSQSELSELFSQSQTRGPWKLVQSIRAGRTKIGLEGAKRAVRVARTGYIGNLKYRYLTDSEEP
jgi:hypothetical protein